MIDTKNLSDYRSNQANGLINQLSILSLEQTNEYTDNGS